MESRYRSKLRDWTGNININSENKSKRSSSNYKNIKKIEIIN